jgi:hypothetical protein
MSLFSARRVGGVLAVLVAGCAPAVAAADPVSFSVNTRCTSAVAGGELTGSFTATTPLEASESTTSQPVAITLQASTEDYSVPTGVAEFEGSMRLSLRVTTGAGIATPEVSLALQRQAPGPIEPTDQIPALEAPDGPVVIELLGATLDLRAYDDSGEPAAVDTDDSDLDGDPATFSEACTVSTLDLQTIAAYRVGTSPVSPFVAPQYVGIEPGKRMVSVDWYPATSFFPIKAYGAAIDYLSGSFAGESVDRELQGLDPHYDLAAPTTPNAITIGAADTAGRSGLSDTVEFRGLAEALPDITRSFPVAATVVLPTIARVPVKLSGTLSATWSGADHRLTGSLVLAPVTTRLVAASTVPISGQVALIRSGPLSGTYSNHVLRLFQDVRVKVQNLKAFGAIPIELGNNCQTKTISRLAIRSAPAWPTAEPTPFDAFTGTVTGVVEVSDLNGCAAVSQWFSAATANAAGTITMTVG